MNIGIFLAIVAMVAWGLGDFFIQRSARRVGDFEALFVITAFGSVVLLPFVWHNLPQIFHHPMQFLPLLLLAGGILCIASLLDLQALKIGKLAIVEPIWSLEIPASAVLAYFIIGEHLTHLQIIIIIFLIIGLVCVSFKGGAIKVRHFFEKGALIAVMAAMLMGSANFFMGIAGRDTDSLMTNFVTSLIIAIVTGIVLVYKGSMKKMMLDIRTYPRTLLAMATFDNIAWLAFVGAMALAPISIVVALSESYIIIAVMLGIIINKEKIRWHQVLGLVLALGSAIVLAVITV